MIVKLVLLLRYLNLKRKAAKRRREFLRRLIVMKRKAQIRTRNVLKKDCLISHKHCEWYYLRSHGSDESFISAISLRRTDFEYLLSVFQNHYTVGGSGPGRKGRPRGVSASTALGLLLTFYRSSSEYMILSRMFGLTPSTISRILSRAEKALDQALKGVPEATVRWPTLEEQSNHAQAVQNRHPYVVGRWGFVDGKNYAVQKPTFAELQNAMYNGWLHSTLITGVFCFAADGTLAWGKHNVVGSWNDGEISRTFQEKLMREDINLPDHGVLADTAFPVCRGLENRIQTPLKEGDLNRIPPERRREAQTRSDAVTSMRQSAEWGMGAVEKVYRRLMSRLPWNQSIRGRRISNVYRLYNFRVRRTGISEIRSYFYD